MFDFGGKGRRGPIGIQYFFGSARAIQNVAFGRGESAYRNYTRLPKNSTPELAERLDCLPKLPKAPVCYVGPFSYGVKLPWPRHAPFGIMRRPRSERVRQRAEDVLKTNTQIFDHAMKNIERTVALLILLALPLLTGCFTMAGGLIGGTVGGSVGLVGGTCVGQPIAGMKGGAVAGAVVGGVTGAVVDSVILAPLGIGGAIIDAVKPKPGLKVEEIIEMHEEGVSNELIIASVEAQGMREVLSSNDLIKLSQKNIDAEVIVAMQLNITSDQDDEGDAEAEDEPNSSGLPSQLQNAGNGNDPNRPQAPLPQGPLATSPDMTPAVSGEPFGQLSQSMPGFTPQVASGFTPQGASGGRWDFGEARTPGGARIAPSQAVVPPPYGAPHERLDETPYAAPHETPYTSPYEMQAIPPAETVQAQPAPETIFR